MLPATRDCATPRPVTVAGRAPGRPPSSAPPAPRRTAPLRTVRDTGCDDLRRIGFEEPEVAILPTEVDDADGSDDASAAIEPTGRPPTLPDQPRSRAPSVRAPVLDESASMPTARWPAVSSDAPPRPRVARSAIPCPKAAGVPDPPTRWATVLVRCTSPPEDGPSQLWPLALARAPLMLRLAVTIAREGAAECTPGRTPADRLAAASVAPATRAVEAKRAPLPIEIFCL